MSFFSVNGSPCISPKALKEQCDRAGLDCSSWYGKANALHHVTGVDPSIAWVLVGQGFTEFFNGLKVQTTNGVLYLTDMKVESRINILPSAAITDGFYLIKMVDQRYSLSHAFVSERYNLVDTFNVEAGTFTYQVDTTNDGSPWDWPDIFTDVWKIASTKALSLGSAVFPQYTAQDLDFRYTTRRDALEQLCLLTGTTIVPNPDGTFSLVNYETSISNIQTIASNYLPYKIGDDWLVKDEPGHAAPFAFKLYFKKYNAENTEISEYEIINKVSTLINLSGHEIPIRIPAYKVTDETNLPAPEKSPAIATAFIVSIDKHLGKTPEHSKTYFDFRPVTITQGIARVIYFDIDGVPKTQITPSLPINWVPKPYEDSNQSKSSTMLSVTINSAVETTDSTFQVEDVYYRVVFGTEDRQFITVHNVFDEAFEVSDVITVFKRDTDDEYEPDRASAGTGTTVIHYELTQDMALVDVAKLAKPVTPAGVLDTLADAFYVLDPQQQFVGKTAFTDSIEEQDGYRGYAVKTVDDYNSTGVPGYRIISQEGPMRFIAVTIAEEVTSESLPVDCTPIDQDIYGNPFNGRFPAASSGTGTFTVGDKYDIADKAEVGDKWLVIYDESEDEYNFLFSLEPEGYHRIRGKISGSVSRADTTVTLITCEAVNGKEPPATVTATIPPYALMDIPASFTDWIYAIWNEKVGADDTDHWDTGDGANWYWIARGRAGFNSGTKQVLYNDGDNEPNMQWKEVTASTNVKDITGAFVYVQDGDVKIRIEYLRESIEAIITVTESAQQRIGTHDANICDTII